MLSTAQCFLCLLLFLLFFNVGSIWGLIGKLIQGFVSLLEDLGAVGLTIIFFSIYLRIAHGFCNFIRFGGNNALPTKSARAKVCVAGGNAQAYQVGVPSKFTIQVLDKTLRTSVDRKTFLDSLMVELNPTSFPILGDRGSCRIQVVREYEHEDSDVDENVLTINVSVCKSGKYELDVRDGSLHVLGSSKMIQFRSADLDAEKTSFQKPSPCIVLTVSTKFDFYLRPKDKFGNICSVSDSDLAKFDLNFAHANGQPLDYFTTCEYLFTHSGQPGTSIRFSPEFKRVGIYHGEILYDRHLVDQGTFDLLVMSKDEYNTFLDMLTKDTNRIYHDARLLSVDLAVEKGEGKKVCIYVGSKQLSIREYIWQFIPLRVATFRVTPITKVTILPESSPSVKATNTVSISDGFQKVTVQMEATVARRVVAMFSHFIKQRIGGSELSFASKQTVFYSRLKELQTNFRLSFSLLRIRRNDIINSTMEQTKWFSKNDWFKNFRIEFCEEQGVDAGGVRREWLEQSCVECFKPSPTGLFSPLGNSRLVHPNPASQRDPKWTLKHYELAGKIVGKCLFESAVGTSHKQMVNGRFSRSFLAQVVGLRPNYRHFEQDEPELYMQKIKYILENEVEPMDMTFTEEEYDRNGTLLKTVNLVTHGSKLKVTDSNKVDYLQALATYKLETRVKHEVDAFSKGLRELVPEELLVNFDENELEMLWCGDSHFDIEDLKTNFLKGAGGWSFDPTYSKILEWFWAALTGFSDEERARLLQFTTGSSLLPHGGFAELNPKFQISLSPEYGKLPIAHTCISEICLSDNLNFEKFQKCLLTAVNEGNQGFAFR